MATHTSSRRAQRLWQKRFALYNAVTARRYRRLTAAYRIAGNARRIYHYHIRKTAGTSLNSAFWGLGNARIHWRDLERRRRRRVCHQGRVFVVHDRGLINQGAYFFANSHVPAHQLALPAQTFTITILRDPVQRVVSHYRSLRWFQAHEPARPVLQTEGAWLGQSFGDFLDRIPSEHLARQLFMFSATYNVAQAAERLMQCSAVLFTEQFTAGLSRLSRRLGLPLQEQHERRFVAAVTVTPAERARARDLLAAEYRLLDVVRRQRAQ